MKKINSFFAILAAAAMFAACGGNSENKTSDDSGITKQEEEAIENLKDSNEPKSVSFEFTIDDKLYKLDESTVKSTIIPFACYNKEDETSLVWVSGINAENPGEEISIEIDVPSELNNGTIEASEIIIMVSEKSHEGQSKTLVYLSGKYIPVEFSSVKTKNAGPELDSYSLDLEFSGNFKSILDDSSPEVTNAKYSIKY